MFGIFADLLSSVITILIPAFASYKALRSPDPSQLAPWLMYWVVLSGILLAESWTVFILGWFPFYSWFRLFFMAYLVLPQTQGAQVLYVQYVEPFLGHHEREIEELIARSHDRAKSLGLQYFYRAIDLIREKVLGLPPQRPAPPSPPGPATYAQSLLSRLYLPTGTGTGSAAPAGDWLSTIGSSLAAMATSSSAPSSSSSSTGQGREARVEELAANGGLMPREMANMSRAEKARFISSQRELLSVIGMALSKEELNLGEEDTASDESAEEEPLRKNRSENSFHHVYPEDIVGSSPVPAPRREPVEAIRPSSSSGGGGGGGGGWTSGWFGYGARGRGSSGVDWVRGMEQNPRPRA